MQIVLWKLGSLEDKIFPTEDYYKFIKNQLDGICQQVNEDGGYTVHHLISGPDIEFDVLDLDDETEHFVLPFNNFPENRGVRPESERSEPCV